MYKIVCSNIRFDNPADGINAWPNRKEFLAKTLSDLNLDFFGTQEGREPQLRELENLLDYTIVDKHREWIDERMYPSLFNRTKNIKASGDFWLSETPHVAGSKSFESMFPRLATWMETDQFFICNVHLDHDKEVTREKQAQVLCEQVQLANKNELPLIIMGDFNTDPKSNVHQYILEKLKVYDPWESLSKTEETSFHLFQGEHEQGYRIDWILFSESIKCKNIELLKHQQENVFLSDHFPVYCEFEL